MCASMERSKLIKCVRKYPLLYNNVDSDYTNMEKKEAAWNEIGKILGVSGKDCKKNWTLLRDYHRTYLKKQKELEKDCEEGQVVFKKWKFADEMSFLLPHIRNKNNAINIRMSSIADEQVTDDSWNNYTYAQDISDTPTMPTTFKRKEASISTPPPTSTSDFLYPHKQRRESNYEEESPEEPSFASFLKYTRDKEKSTDEIDYFFNGVATTVKSFPPEFKIRAKAQIFQLISQMELEVLERKRKNCPHSATELKVEPILG